MGHPHLGAVHGQAVRIMRNLCAPATMYRVELQQKRVLLRVPGEVIDQHDILAKPAVKQVAKGQFSHPAKAIERDFRS